MNEKEMICALMKKITFLDLQNRGASCEGDGSISFVHPADSEKMFLGRIYPDNKIVGYYIYGTQILE